MEADVWDDVQQKVRKAEQELLMTKIKSEDIRNKLQNKGQSNKLNTSLPEDISQEDILRFPKVIDEALAKTAKAKQAATEEELIRSLKYALSYTVEDESQVIVFTYKNVTHIGATKWNESASHFSNAQSKLLEATSIINKRTQYNIETANKLDN